MNAELQDLIKAGQSVWLDNIRRSMFASGELRSLIDLGLRGMTSNPTIFEKAIGSGTDYDEQLRELLDQHDPNAVFEALAIADIRSACDEFRALYDSSGGGDGFVSLEVSPLLANDTDATIVAAKRLWRTVDRPNLMVKIPGTPAGVPAITEAIAAGVNVNVTLLFSIESYEAQANAYIAGIERRIADGLPVEGIASVASVFVSRIDTAVDKLLEDRIAKGDALTDLLGKTGIANLKLTYERFKRLFRSERFERLAARGAKVQRPLWASTSTKNPAYSDLMYVETVVGRDTVNTMPPATLDALMDHGRVVADTVEQDVAGAQAALEALNRASISLFDVTKKLQVDGVKSFADSYNQMLEAIAQKQERLRGASGERVSISLGKAEAGPDAALEALAKGDFLRKLWGKDPAPWSADPQHAEIIRHSLGWLDFPQRVFEDCAELVAFARETAPDFDDAVVLGMGGSSLTPDVLAQTFGHIKGFPRLRVLDSTDPVQIRTLEESLDLARTLFIVASKSGTTMEPLAFLRYFYDRVAKVVGIAHAGSHFIVITDPGTSLAKEAGDDGFRRVFLNDRDIGGRYSALSYFGMVPAAIAGYDVRMLLDRGLDGLHANDKMADPRSADGVRFGATIAALAKAGRNKLTIVTHPLVESFGMWAEQLIGESTGKNGIGIVPVEGEPLGAPEHYGDDRVFVYVGFGLPNEHVEGFMDANAIQTRLELLEAAGHPVIRLAMRDQFDLGAQFVLWEVASTAAAAVLGIDAFDEPNVQESKDNTARLLAEFAQAGKLPEPEAKLATDTVRVTPLTGSRDAALGEDLPSALSALLAAVRPGDYVAITAFLPMNDQTRLQLQEARVAIRNGLVVATTVGFGPRFLHSTGQLHKGGPSSAFFLQLTAEPPYDVPIPGMVGFRTLEKAQALGDFMALDSRGRRGARLQLVGPLPQALESLIDALDDAVATKA